MKLLNQINSNTLKNISFSGEKSPAQLIISTPVLDTMRNLHGEIKDLRSESKHLRTGFSRIINSIERRQRVLEAQLDVLTSYGTFGTFQETAVEYVKQQLKVIHDDLKCLKYQVGYVFSYYQVGYVHQGALSKRKSDCVIIMGKSRQTYLFFYH